MIWQNPWAWLGLLFLAVPIAVHLLARRSARVQSFPSLRFLTMARPLATRRTRLSDPLLFAVRAAIIIGAVAALAQPYLLSAERRAGAARALARAIVVDTSASMRRVTPAGDTALAVARRDAATAAAEASAVLIIETAAPGTALAGAAAWLDTRAGQREVVVLSDFQLGALDSLDVAHVPPHIGVQLRRIAITAVDSGRTVQHGAFAVTRAGAPGDDARFEWTRTAAAPAADGLQLLVDDAENGTAAALRHAAHELGVPPVPLDRPIAMIFTGDSATIGDDARALHAAWMGNVVAALARDPDLAAAAAAATITRDAAAASARDSAPTIVGDAAPPAPWLTVARTDGGDPVVLAAADGERLLLLVRTAAATSTGAAVVAAVGRAAATSTSAELEPAVLPDPVLRALERASGTDSPRAASTGQSDGRWIWLLCLALLAVESWLRRGTARPAEEA